MSSKLTIDYLDYLATTNLVFLIKDKYYKVIDDIKTYNLNSDVKANVKFDAILYKESMPTNIFPQSNFTPLIHTLFNKLFPSKLAIEKNNKVHFLFKEIEHIISPDQLHLKLISEAEIAKFNNQYFLISFDEIDNFSPTIIEFNSNNHINIKEAGKYVSKDLLRSRLPDAIYLS